jgi:WD40 repeat protein
LTGDGARAVTVDLSFTGHVFDVASGRQLAVFHPRYTGGVTCFALSPDGTVAAQCDAQSLQSLATPAALDLWDLRTGKLMHSLASSGVISSVGFNPDGRMFVFTSSGATTTRSTAALAQSEGKPGTFVYETHSGRLVISFPGAASAAAFGPSLEFPAVAYATVGDDLGHVYDFTSRVNHPLTGDTDVIESMRFNSAGTYVVTGSKDDTARVFDANTGGAAVEVLAGDTDRIRDAGFGLNGTSIATASEDGTTRLWASPTPRPSRTLPGSDAGAVTVAFTADSSRIVDVANPAEGAIRPGVGRILDARTLSVLARLRAPAGQSFAGAEPTRDGRFVATLSGRYDQRLRSVVPTAAESYDARTGRLLATVTATSPIAANLDYAGHTLATEGLDGNSNEWDLRTGRLLHHLRGTNIAVTGAFSRDGSQLAIAHYPTLPRSVGLSTTFGPVTIDVWDARTGRLRRRITGATLAPQEPGTTFYAPLNLAFSPDGRLLAFSGADPAVEVYDAHSVRLVATLAMSGLSGGSYAASLTFSPDGKLLAAGSASGTYLWRVPSLQSLDQFEQVSAGSSLPFVGAGFGVTAGFTADSRYLTTSGDSSVEAWDPADHLQLFKAFPAVQGALSPNATEFVTAGASGLALYPCDLCGGMKQLLALASRRTTRQLTASERASYLGQG